MRSLLVIAVFCSLARAADPNAIDLRAPEIRLWPKNYETLAPNSTDYYATSRKAGVPAEFHVYLRGGHGFGMTGRTPDFAKLSVSGRPARFKEWMLDQGFLR
jgi:acetyl esterase/lipase